MAKILFLEDDLFVGEAIVDVLESISHTVEWIKNGQEAHDRLHQNEYDMAILDWTVPGLEGVEVCRKYRATGGLIPILLLTGKTAVGEMVYGLDAGADDYLTKPFSMQEMIARVRALLRRPTTPAGDGTALGS